MQRRGSRLRTVVNTTPNTFIGGVAAEIYTKEVLSTYLKKYPTSDNLDSADITSFKIIGSDIECNVSQKYHINKPMPNTITYYRDYENLKEIASNIFSYNPILYETILTEMVSASSSSNWINTPLLRTIYAPKNKALGLATGVSNGNLNSTKKLLRVYFDEYLNTCNDGNKDADLNSVKNRYIRFFSESNPSLYTQPDNITDLNIIKSGKTSASISWNQPDSYNRIDYYEIYVNGNLNNIVYNDVVEYVSRVNMKGNIIGLNFGQSYVIEVVSVDRYFQKGKSNSITVTLDGNTDWFIDNLQMYYKFNEISGSVCNDELGNWNGSNDAGIVLNQAGVHNKCYYYNGSNLVNLGNPTPIYGQQTTCMWVKAQDLSVKRCPLEGGTYTQWGTWNCNQNGQIIMLVNGANMTSYAPIILNEWCHVMQVRDFRAGTTKAFVNGVRTSEDIHSYLDSNNITTYLKFGKGYAGFWKGWIDEACFFNRAFTDQEALDFYNNTLIGELI